jgi:hypothetical protein
VLPNDILFIRYEELSSHPESRLHLLGCIGSLLNKQIGSYTRFDLDMSSDEWALLKSWMMQGNGANFWLLQEDSLQVREACTKHVLIGTYQLLSDIRLVSKGVLMSEKPFDHFWNLARNYVSAEIALEMEK